VVSEILKYSSWITTYAAYSLRCGILDNASSTMREAVEEVHAHIIFLCI
jgi:hypothetical protein